MRVKEKIKGLKVYFFLPFLVFIFLFSLSFYSFTAKLDENYWLNFKDRAQKVMEIDENNVMANFQYTIALANLGMIEEAYDHIEMIKDKISVEDFNRTIEPYFLKLKQNPNHKLYLNYAAFGETINSEYEMAIPYFKKLLELEPDNVWIRNFLAATYLELDKYDTAETEVKKALDVEDNKYSHLILSFINYERGNYVRALLELSRSGDLASKIILGDK